MTQQAKRMALGTASSMARALDRELALSRVGGDLELLQEIAQLFLDDAARMLGEIRSAVEARDAKQLDHSAHTLKGCVSNFGAQRLYEAALMMERMGRGGDLATADSEFRTLESEMHQLVHDLCALVKENGANS
jgi:HPt (histidine-containing phosphotransfer) domain-containing protein